MTVRRLRTDDIRLVYDRCLLAITNFGRDYPSSLISLTSEIE